MSRVSQRKQQPKTKSNLFTWEKWFLMLTKQEVDTQSYRSVSELFYWDVSSRNVMRAEQDRTTVAEVKDFKKTLPQHEWMTWPSWESESQRRWSLDSCTGTYDLKPDSAWSRIRGSACFGQMTLNYSSLRCFLFLDLWRRRICDHFKPQALCSRNWVIVCLPTWQQLKRTSLLVNVIDWPAQSSDSDLAENLWVNWREESMPSNLEELQQTTAAWYTAKSEE